MIYATTGLRLEEWLYIHDPFSGLGLPGNYRDTLGFPIMPSTKFESL